ncbi:S9 family peptidase [Runella zeae]|uniref:S9 family peptidase n=1 Tax=Runella zeae TaxID=94255 RepID=UPI0023526AEC|nr:S9 family peptidase [Runella zeae]
MYPKKLSFLLFLAVSIVAEAQTSLTPDQLWKLGRVSGRGISKDSKYVVYSVSTPNIETDKSSSKTYIIPINGGTPTEIKNADSLLANTKISPDGKYKISSEEVKIKKISGSDFYPDLPKSNVLIYDQLNYRHWDEWEDGKFGHVMLTPINGDPAKDLMQGEPYDCPQKPFGGDEDFVWSTDGKKVVYVAKKKFGTPYAISTNTDLYAYDIATGTTTNLTEENKGYDINPTFNQHGQMAWLQMKRDGYESDKQDLIVSNGTTKMNLTAQRDDIHVESYTWNEDGRSLFFIAPTNGTLQLFKVTYPGLTKMMPMISQITKGDFDVSAIVGQSGNTLIVSRSDMNHAAELYSVNLTDGQLTQLTHVNDDTYSKLSMCKTERRFVKTVDGKNMLVWVIYPPNFDPKQKYPALLYCQGGPQSPLTQFYSFRWNFQLMASQGYIVVAPNRRGMPGHGTRWNEQISKDHGGIVMQDYLSAIDNVSKEVFVDKNRLGCVGASYGGYSAFMLAGMHQKRFKTFIAHDGIFDFRSMYGSTEEVWFPDWDYGGAYWDTKNLAAQKSYREFSPSNFVAKWDAPILIFQGGKDYRVPLEQSLQAFQAAQLRGIKSRLVVLPDENHWVLHAQNAQVWQREFFKWLKETL